MCTARSVYENMSLYAALYKKNFRKIDLSNFIDVLEVDTKRRVVRVEPLVSCGQLTQTLLPLGWIPAILPELDELTVGGLIMGFGIETSSHKYGLFQHICVSYELVLPDGKVVTCSETENPDLFYSIPWSHGTLGFLLSAEIRIVPAKKYAAITYEPFNSRKLLLEKFEAVSRSDKYDFVESLVYGPESGVLMTGVLTDNAESSKIHKLGKWYGPWFYKHVETFFKKGTSIEYIPLRDYYHRHTRSLFWAMEDIIYFGNHPLFRLLLGWFLPIKITFMKLITSDRLHDLQIRTHIFEDFLVPISELNNTLDVQHDLVGFYPLWLCPCKILTTPKRGLVNPVTDDELYVDVGIYGMAPIARRDKGKHFDYLSCHKKLEKFIREVGGFQALYAQTYQTREEFENMFDHRLYYKTRKAYGCESLPIVYDKISRDARK